MDRSTYYKIEEAEEFKQRFSSWIGKRTHIGGGVTETLKAIVITPKRILKPTHHNQKLFKIEFKFENRKRLSAYEFLFYNALLSFQNNSEEQRNRSESAA